MILNIFIIFWTVSSTEDDAVDKIQDVVSMIVWKSEIHCPTISFVLFLYRRRAKNTCKFTGCQRWNKNVSGCIQTLRCTLNSTLFSQYTGGCTCIMYSFIFRLYSTDTSQGLCDDFVFVFPSIFKQGKSTTMSPILAIAFSQRYVCVYIWHINSKYQQTAHRMAIHEEFASCHWQFSICFVFKICNTAIFMS